MRRARSPATAARIRVRELDADRRPHSPRPLPPFAAFIQMASDIKARMAVVPAGDDAADKGKVAVGRGETVGKAGGGGCC